MPGYYLIEFLLSKRTYGPGDSAFPQVKADVESYLGSFEEVGHL
jgi:hypothetical protein